MQVIEKNIKIGKRELKFKLPENDHSTGIIRSTGLYEKYIVISILNLQNRRKYRKIIDLGANFGYYTIICGGVIPGASVIAVEPNPDILDILKSNIDANDLKNVELFECAVGNKAENLTIYSNHSNTGTASLHKLDAYDAEYKVPVKTLDSLLVDREGYAPDLIKSDLQGFDLEAIDGARQLIQRSYPDIVLEFAPKEIEMPLPQIKDVFNFLSAAQYIPYIYRGHDVSCFEPVTYNILVEIFEFYKKIRHKGYFNLMFMSSRKRIDAET